MVVLLVELALIKTIPLIGVPPMHPVKMADETIPFVE